MCEAERFGNLDSIKIFVQLVKVYLPWKDHPFLRIHFRETPEKDIPLVYLTCIPVLRLCKSLLQEIYPFQYFGKDFQLVQE
jgi:hypothetical protein